MIEGELFGHVKGAFTGAETTREGLFMHARGGTLFLDEIGELPPATQSKLLRVIEDRRVRPVGSEREIPVDLRFVFATNADLEKEVAAGRFRADLYFRINVMKIVLPPLKDRGEDIQELTTLFMRKLSQQLGMPPVAITDEVRAALARYDWPGNVRELRNMVERTLILGRFPEELGREGATGNAAESGTLAEMERRHILAAVQECGGNRDEAARRLGISRKTIDRKFASWDV
jgi:DNA-binding NtrC family response regulator